MVTSPRELAMTTGALIKHYRELRGLNQSELARRLGIRPQSVQEWEARTTVPNARRLPAIADVLGVEARDLAPGAPLRVENVSAYPVGSATHRLPALGSHPADSVSVNPTDGHVRLQEIPAPVAPGHVEIRRVGNGANPESPVSMIVVSQSWAAAHFPGRDPSAIRVIDVRGDAMAPTLSSGDWVFVDTSERGVDIDALWVFVVQGRRGPEYMIKRVQRRTDGSLMLIQDNDRYPPEVVDAAAQQRLEVAGLICGRHAFTPF